MRDFFCCGGIEKGRLQGFYIGEKLFHCLVLRCPAGADAHGGVVLVGLAHVGHGIALSQLFVPCIGQDKELLVRRGVVQNLTALCLKRGTDVQAWLNERPALMQLTVLTVSLVVLLLFGIFRAGYISSEFIYKQF